MFIILILQAIVKMSQTTLFYSDADADARRACHKKTFYKVLVQIHVHAIKHKEDYIKQLEDSIIELLYAIEARCDAIEAHCNAIRALNVAIQEHCDAIKELDSNNTPLCDEVD